MWTPYFFTLMRYGVDLSHHNTIDWSKLKADFVIYKCTEATTYLDPTYAKAKASGKIIGSYHFARGGDAIKEADWYLKNSSEPICVLDWEIEHSDPVKWCTTFINRLKEKGKFVWFYTNDARAVKYPWPKDWIFWIARYGINDGTPIRKPDFKGYSVWQYTSNGTCPGVAGRVDLNIAEEWAFPIDTPSPISEPEVVMPPTPQILTSKPPYEPWWAKIVWILINAFKSILK